MEQTEAIAKEHKIALYMNPKYKYVVIKEPIEAEYAGSDYVRISGYVNITFPALTSEEVPDVVEKLRGVAERAQEKHNEETRQNLEDHLQCLHNIAQIKHQVLQLPPPERPRTTVLDGEKL